ncbi:MAG: peptide deformylase [Bacillota bacterium]|jgi:peptide deformylase|nr:peptide deformylase [Bacillota bacterium]NLL26987.1 peptide deformylase [Erysipelotrichia bacterium]
MFIDSKKILPDSEPILREKAISVSVPLSDENKEILQAMLEYVRNSQDEKFCEEYNVRPSVGIAAPQIGVSRQMIAVSIKDEDDQALEFALANPIIIANSTKKTYLENGESCLSVPTDVEGVVLRYHRITVRAYNLLTDKVEEIKLKGYPAIVMQHEIDHLKGILYYDRINKINPWHKPEDAISI